MEFITNCYTNMEKNTEIRNLSPGIIFKLSQILDEMGWKELMAVIPNNPLDMSSQPKYTVEQIRLVESCGEKNNKSYTEILLDEWGTSGRVRPTVNTLFNVLIKAHLYRAADYIAVDLFKEETPTRPDIGPAALVDVNLDNLNLADAGEHASALRIETYGDIVHVPYSFLENITGYFNEIPLTSNSLGFSGHKIGAGAFGSVFYGVMPDGKSVAVKRLINDAISIVQQFQAEINTLSSYKHPNLLPLVAFSCDTSNFCLVYEFMPNLSLEDRLALSDSTLVLPWRKRLDIAIGVCRGIHYLHTAKSQPLIHRDIKSANILLDEALEPRVGDFGLVKISPTDTRMTSTIFGTSAYMAPEAFRGDVSVKTDVFSVGVVFLELLTALTPYDPLRDGVDIITYVEGIVDDGSIEMLLDVKAAWDLRVANDIYEISQRCFEDKRKRPFISDVLDALNNTTENISNV